MLFSLLLCLVNFFYDLPQISPLTLSPVLNRQMNRIQSLESFTLISITLPLFICLSVPVLAFYLPRSGDFVLFIWVSPVPVCACHAGHTPELSGKRVWQQENTFTSTLQTWVGKSSPLKDFASLGFSAVRILLLGEQWLIDYGSVMQPVDVINLEKS